MAVAAAGLVADLEPVGQAFEGPHHLLDRAHLAAAHQLPLVAEYADGNTLAVNIESYVVHKHLHSRNGSHLAFYFHVTRLTEAPYIVSHRVAGFQDSPWR